MDVHETKSRPMEALNFEVEYIEAKRGHKQGEPCPN
jgi:hypothetical protein